MLCMDMDIPEENSASVDILPFYCETLESEKNVQWLEAMNEEYNSLIEHNFGS